MSKFDYPIVAVGASAGGIEALKALVECIPTDSRATYVILQHLAPDHESQLVSILGRDSKLPCIQAEEDLALEPGHIYVLPPDRYLSIVDHGLFVETPLEPRGSRMPIDYFMRSLAEAAGPQSIGVILSGTGSDGTLGLRAIQGAGGLSFVQSPETALYDGMPQAAIDSGNADKIGTIGEICASITEHAKRMDNGDQQEFGQADLNSVIALIKARLGLDFSAYKPGTIGRRIRRRLKLLRFEKPSEYLEHLRSDPNELRQLADDMLINVTSFFRDDTVWDEVVAKVITPLVEAAGTGPLRIWVPGCSSGEEAYTLAILFEEHCAQQEHPCDWQIFASDLDVDAISQGREGLYPNSISADVSEERLRQFFRREDNHFRVHKRLRERVVFAHQDILHDPPFSRLDLVSCRNLLIYLDAAHQRQLMDTFHFALREEGFLLLGTSETVSTQSRKFKSISKKAHIYRRRPGRAEARFTARQRGSTTPGRISQFLAKAQRGRTNELHEQVRLSLLDRYAPAGVVIEPDGTIVHYSGPVRRFVETPDGPPTHNVYELLPATLRARVRDTVRRVAMGEKPDGRTVAVRFADRDQTVRVDCVELGQSESADEDRFFVTFVEVGDPHSSVSDDASAAEAGNEQVRHLEHELEIVREDLQTTVEELETSNEELKASNEEAMASNEELQSANEELETSREELQSLNEELVTVNHQLEDKIEEVEKATDDLRNLLSSTRLPVIFLDNDFHISSFTPTMRGLIELRDTDIGRPFGDLARKIDDPAFEEDARKVLEDLQPIECEISDDEGRTYLRRLQPYRTSEERIGGVVATFTDITDQARTARLLASRERQARIIAKLGQSALSIREIDDFLDEACASLREALDCDFSKVLKLSDDGKAFNLVAGAGWNPGTIGKSEVTAGRHSQAGYTMLEEGAVLVADLEEEKRFEGPPLLKDHSVRSGISTVITVGQKPWGVIGLHDRKAGVFSHEDLSILEAASNIIALAVMQSTREEFLARERLVLSLAISVANMGVWTVDTATDEVTWDQRLRKITGMVNAKSRPAAETFYDHIAPEDRERVEQAMRKTVETGKPFEEQFRFFRPDGEMIWLFGKGERVTQGDRQIVLGINSDITQRKQHEEQNEFMMRELDHRVKNLLAVILSITRITSKTTDSVEEFLEDFSARLDAMARTHSLLAQARWSGTHLRSLLQDEVVGQAADGQVELSGPKITVSPSAAQSLSMIFHELTTNALKYGALSRSRGKVEVRWEQVEGDRLELCWKESGGPEVTKPERQGFGTTVLDRMAHQQLGAHVSIEWKKKGIEVVLDMPMTRLLPVAEAEPQKQAIADHASHACLKDKKVLVLDDEWLIAEQHADVLASVGAEIIGPFLKLEDALGSDYANADIAVLDFALAEGTTVIPLAEKLKEIGIPIVFVTGYGSRTELPPQFDDDLVVPKPASADAILDSTAHLLANGHAAP